MEVTPENLYYGECQMYWRPSQINAIDITNLGTVESPQGRWNIRLRGLSRRRRACKSGWPYNL